MHDGPLTVQFDSSWKLGDASAQISACELQNRNGQFEQARLLVRSYAYGR